MRADHMVRGFRAASRGRDRSKMSVLVEKQPFQRLPNDVVPINYKLKLHPDLKVFTFKGELDITAKVTYQIYFICKLELYGVHTPRAASVLI